MANAHQPNYGDGLEVAHPHESWSAINEHNSKIASNGPKEERYLGMELLEYNGGGAHSRNSSIFSGKDSDNEPLTFPVRPYEKDSRYRLHRVLKTRQISMIALGGALGTGLLINTGPYLANSGPISMWIGYTLVGVLCYAVMAALGEMTCWLPLASGFSGLASRFVDPALGFSLGWNYWFKYIFLAPSNVVAFAMVVEHWSQETGYNGPASNPALYISIVLVLIITINYFGVGIFGEFEFWLGSVKMIIMIGLVIFTFALVVGGGHGQATPGFKYWAHPGGFAPYVIDGSAGKFLGFLNVLPSAVFSFLGTELVGVTVGEAQNPRKAVPRAVKLTFFRIVLFYIILVLLLGLAVPYDSLLLHTSNNASRGAVSSGASPFVVAANLAGVKAAPAIINVCLLIFTFSAANSDLYIATRSLYSLAIEGSAPRIFSRTNSHGVPIYAMALSSGFCVLAFAAINFIAFFIFQLLASLVTIFGILTWLSILISHVSFVRARRAQNIQDTALGYVSPFGVYGSLAAAIFSIVILLSVGLGDFESGSVNGVTKYRFIWAYFIAHCVGVIIFAGMFVSYKFLKRSKRWKPHEVDLFGGKAQIDEDEKEFLAGKVTRNAGVKERRWAELYRVTLGNLF